MDGERWHARLGEDHLGSYSSVHDAVAWGIDAGCVVVVRTLDGYVGVTKSLPAYLFDIDGNPWPPSAEDWQQIERRYAYELEKARWLGEHAPHVSGEPTSACTVELPAAFGRLFVEHLDETGDNCAALGVGPAGRSAFGPLAEIVASAVQTRLDPAGIAAVIRVLDDQRRRQPWEKRSTRQLHIGSGEMYHVTACGNRESIRRHGLDWTRMGEFTGIAGSPVPEMAGIFLDDSEDGSFWHQMSRHPTDIWEVDVRGYWIEDGPSGWHVVRRAIPPGRLRLIRRDVPAGGSRSG